MDAERTERIRALNDRLRTTGLGGQIMISTGLACLGQAATIRALCAVAKFENFDPGNDPYGERDFGLVIVSGQRIFWKIDYYDSTLSFGAEDPTDEATCRRVITLMLAEEY